MDRILIISSLIVCLLCIVLVFAISYQRFGERSDRARYVRGESILVQGRRIHFVKAGCGKETPTIVIEAGSGDNSESWRAVIDRVGLFAPVLAYDRAGQGWSDRASANRSIGDRANDLQELIERAAGQGPYILVGHSYGGYIVRMLAHGRQIEVVGLVLIEASEECYALGIEGRAGAAAVMRRAVWASWLARVGVLRVLSTYFARNSVDKARKFNSIETAEGKAIKLQTAHYQATADEMISYGRLEIERSRLGGAHSLKDLPMAVVTAGLEDLRAGTPASSSWLDAQRRLCLLSSNVRRFTALRSGHNVQETEPEVIVQSIREIWEAARGQGIGDGSRSACRSYRRCS